MDITNICMICLENKNNLRNISNQNATEICPKLKLEKCVPEIVSCLFEITVMNIYILFSGLG